MDLVPGRIGRDGSCFFRMLLGSESFYRDPLLKMHSFSHNHGSWKTALNERKLILKGPIRHLAKIMGGRVIYSSWVLAHNVTCTFGKFN